MTYQDFDLRIERSGGGLRVQVLGSPAGEASADVRLPYSDLEIENFLLRIGRPPRRVRRVESTAMRAAKTFGAALYSTIFSGPVREAFDASLERVQEQKAGLRIRLRLGDARLADLPWELLYDATVNRFLALSIQTPLVRYLELPDRIPPLALTLPIRVLVLISGPSNAPALDAEAEWTKLTAALADLSSAGHVAIERLDGATLPSLQKRLRRSEYHIFHFIGHGEFDEHAQDGVLFFEDDHRRAHKVSGQQIGTLLHDHRPLRAAVLNACEGARTSIADPFAGTAQSLVQQGLPAVVAMQFEIADEVAASFAHALYGAIADGYPIDASLGEARKALFAQGHDVEWATPVLYLRAPDGRIFDIEKTRRPKTAAVSPRVSAAAEESPAARAAARLRDAEAALAVGDIDAAQEMLDEARRLDPEARPLSWLADELAQQRAVAATRAEIRRQFDAALARASALFEKGDAAAALAAADDALRLRPRDPDAKALVSRIRAGMREGGGRERGTPPRTHAPKKKSPKPGEETFPGEADLIDPTG